MTNTNTTTIAVGALIQMSTTHSDGSVIRYKARVVRDNGNGTLWVEIPKRVRSLPFPPLDGKRYGLFRVADIAASVVR